MSSSLQIRRLDHPAKVEVRARERDARVTFIDLDHQEPCKLFSSLKVCLKVRRSHMGILAELAELMAAVLNPKGLCITSLFPVLGIRLLLFHHK